MEIVSYFAEVVQASVHQSIFWILNSSAECIQSTRKSVSECETGGCSFHLKKLQYKFLKSFMQEFLFFKSSSVKATRKHLEYVLWWDLITLVIIYVNGYSLMPALFVALTEKTSAP